MMAEFSGAGQPPRREPVGWPPRVGPGQQPGRDTTAQPALGDDPEAGSHSDDQPPDVPARPVPSVDEQPGTSRPAGTPFPGHPDGSGGGPVRFADDALLSVTLTYASYSGPGTAAEIMEAAIRKLPGYVSESFTFDEPGSSVTFEHRGHFDPRSVLPEFSQRGVQGVRVRVRAPARR